MRKYIFLFFLCLSACSPKSNITYYHTNERNNLYGVVDSCTYQRNQELTIVNEPFIYFFSEKGNKTLFWIKKKHGGGWIFCFQTPSNTNKFRYENKQILDTKALFVLYGVRDYFEDDCYEIKKGLIKGRFNSKDSTWQISISVRFKNAKVATKRKFFLSK